MNIAEHLELHLGPIERGWASLSLPGVQVTLFRDRPVSGTITLGTLGLSNSLLEMPRRRHVRQELLLACLDDSSPDDLAKLLLGTAELSIQSGRAVLRGEVIPLGGRILPDSRMDSLYPSLPVVYPDGIATFADSTPATVAVWRIPLHPSEAAFVGAHGWSKFEDRLETEDPNLYELRRRHIA